MEMGKQLSALACLTSRIVSAIRKPHQLSQFEFHALLAICTRHPSCVTALAEQMELDKTRLSKVLRSLEKRELVRRTQGREDHRIDHLDLTESGASLARMLLDDLDRIGRALTEEMQEEERAAFSRFLETTGDLRIADILHPPHHTPPNSEVTE